MLVHFIEKCAVGIMEKTEKSSKSKGQIEIVPLFM